MALSFRSPQLLLILLVEYSKLPFPSPGILLHLSLYFPAWSSFNSKNLLPVQTVKQYLTSLNFVSVYSVHATGMSLLGILQPGRTRDPTEVVRLDSKHTLSLPPTFTSLYNHHVLWSLLGLLQPHIGLALPTLAPPRQASSSASRVSLYPFVHAPSELLWASEWMWRGVGIVTSTSWCRV